MTIHLRSPAGKSRQAVGRTAEIAGAHPDQDTGSAPAPAAVTWFGAQIREQIQRAQAALAPTATPAHGRTYESRRSPLAHKETEP